MLAITHSAIVGGVDGAPVSVEVHVGPGLPAFTVVGLPDTSCRESRDRVRAALVMSDLDWPDQKITVNLAPGGLPKAGVSLDLAVAVGVLVASGQVPDAAVDDLAFLSEVGLDGSLRPVVGALPMADALPQAAVVVSPANHAEVALVSGTTSRPVATLSCLVAILRGDAPWPEPPDPLPPPPPEIVPDLADVRGQVVARRALEIAAAGGHHLLLVGPPGAGKTMLARRLPGLLPALDDDDALVATRVRSAAGLGPRTGLVRHPPFRAPHHQASAVALIGGGRRAMQPGEVSLAHGGVLFLDELGEFAPTALEGLRQPLEEGVVRVSRVHASRCYPARFLLVAAMNPCPCGASGAPGACRCSAAARARYLRRLSGPLVDRLDLRVPVARPSADDLLGRNIGEPTADVAGRVAAARRAARDRGGTLNVTLSDGDLDRVAPVPADAIVVLRRAVSDGRLSGRGLHRLRCVARTIADLAGAEQVSAAHFAEALAYRSVVGPSGPAS